MMKREDPRQLLVALVIEIQFLWWEWSFTTVTNQDSLLHLSMEKIGRYFIELNDPKISYWYLSAFCRPRESTIEN